MRFFYHMYGRHIADLQIYLKEDGMENFVWGRYKNQGNTWRYSNVTVFGNNYTVRENETVYTLCAELLTDVLSVFFSESRRNHLGLRGSYD